MYCIPYYVEIGQVRLGRESLSVMLMDTTDKMAKTERSATANSCHETAPPADTTGDSMGNSLKHQTNQAKREPMKRYKMRGDKGGYGIALVSLLMAFLVRWLLDSYLNEALPFAIFLIAVGITAWFGGVGASLLAIALGGLISNWFFVHPRYEFALTGLVDQAGMVVYFTIGFATVGFIQTWRWAWKRTEAMAHDLQKKTMS